MQAKVRRAIQCAVRLTNESEIAALDAMTIDELLSGADIYFLARRVVDVPAMIRLRLRSFTFKSAETKMGGTFESVVSAICGRKNKKGDKGLNKDVVRSIFRFLLSLKSGSKWGNAQSTEQQQADFVSAKTDVVKVKCTIEQLLATPQTEIALMGICYGKTETKLDVKCADIKLVGQVFWYFLAGDTEFYKELFVEIYDADPGFPQLLESKLEETFNRLLTEFYAQFPREKRAAFMAVVEHTCGNLTPYDPVHYLLDPTYEPPAGPKPKRQRTGKGSKRRRLSKAPKPKRRRAGETRGSG